MEVMAVKFMENIFENHFFGRRHQFDMVFCNIFDANNDVTTAQGGDFVSEIIAFEDPISETERLEVERYLMAKWNLPNAGAASALRYPEKTGLLGAASNATVVVQTDSATTPPIAFAGEGELRKTTAGRLSLGLGGVRKEGVVNAATDPDYIGGIGSLMVVPDGVTISFR